MATLQFRGEEIFTSAPEAVFTLLTDFQRLGPLLPDIDTFECEEPTRLKGVVRPGFSFLKGKLKLELSQRESNSPNFVVIEAKTKGLGCKLI